MIDKEIDALFIGKGNVMTSQSIDLGKDNTIVIGTISNDELKAFKETGFSSSNFNDAGYFVSTKINLNINITTDYDEKYFYFYNNGKLIKRITLEKAYELIAKL